VRAAPTIRSPPRSANWRLVRQIADTVRRTRRLAGESVMRPITAMPSTNFQPAPAAPRRSIRRWP